MKKFKASDVIRPTVVLLIICLVTSLLLAMTNELTKDQIAENEKKAKNDAQMIVMADAAAFDSEDTVTVKIENDKEEIIEYCAAKDAQNNVIGYVFVTESKGYGGTVQVMTGVTNDGKISGIYILKLTETPGLGMNAKKDEFLNEFVGRIRDIAVIKTKPEKDENAIQALTGATITSKAVTGAVNKALEGYEKVKGGANNG